MARSIAFSNWPARPTNGSPCRSSSAPGASPITNRRASRRPTPNTVCVRLLCSTQRVQPLTFAASSDQTSASRGAVHPAPRAVRSRLRPAPRPARAPRPRRQSASARRECRFPRDSDREPRSWRHRIVALAAAVPQPRGGPRCGVDDEQREDRYRRLERDDDDDERNQQQLRRIARVSPGFTSLKLT